MVLDFWLVFVFIEFLLEQVAQPDMEFIHQESDLIGCFDGFFIKHKRLLFQMSSVDAIRTWSAPMIRDFCMAAAIKAPRAR